MPRRSRRTHGFTLIEVAVVVAIVGVVAALAMFSFERARPRANLATTSTELHTLLRNARLNAMATGRQTIVAFFPDAPNGRGGFGRIVVLEDPAGTFFTAAAVPNFDTFDPDTLTANAELLQRLDLPRGVVLATGAGTPAAFPQPYDRIAVGSCTFCGADRGAIRFDGRGRATFYSGVGAPLDAWGGSFALSPRETRATPPTMDGFRLFVVTGAAGGVRTFIRG